MEDTANDDRAYALDTFEDAEAEDEVDAQYSDDDEPEYDEDEMGGDYDTRNYEQPADDDDDSHDEDLKPHQLDPEFDDGESWDEEEQEEFLDEEDEGEYEIDNETAEPGAQRMVQAEPTVIEISSSDDEDEEEGEDEDDEEDKEQLHNTTTAFQRADAHLDYGTSPSYQQTTSERDPQQARIKDEESEIISQVAISAVDSYSEASSESHEYTRPHVEGEGEDEDGYSDEGADEEEARDETKSEEDEQDEIHMIKPSNNQAEQHAGPETEPKHEAEPKPDAMIGGAHDHDNLSPHQTMPSLELHETADAGIISKIPVEDVAIVPLSAADGLEMLSRAVDKESDALSHSVFTESVVEEIATETINDEQSPELPEDDNIQIDQSSSIQKSVTSQSRLELSIQGTGENKTAEIASLKPETQHLPFTVNNGNPRVTAPSSPPLTQSFQSHIEGDKSTLEEIALTSTAEMAIIQLETPLDTQVTDGALIDTANTSMSIAESFESYMAIEQQILDDIESTIMEKPVEDPVPHEANTDIEKVNVEQERNSSLIVEIQARPPSNEPPVASSPAPSFQTQLDEGELASPGSLEQTEQDSQFPQNSSLKDDLDASDTYTNKSFASHIEIDEELQASILEFSQLEEYSTHDADDIYDASAQIDTSEAYDESGNTGIVETASPSLRENTPSMQLADEISTQLRRNFVSGVSSSEEDSDGSMHNDPSVHLARVANASKGATRKRAASTSLYRPRKRLLDARRSPTPETDDSSIRLARASLASQASRSEEESSSMTAAKLQLARHLRDELPDCISLEGLRQHLTKSLDVIAVAAMQPPDPQRAKSGPREYMMSFTIVDYTIGPYAVVEVLIYRPHKDSLPVVKYGDIVLLRNFTVVSLPNKGFGLRSNDVSSWAVFDYEDEPAQIRGPPVEYSATEALYVSYLREWFRLLDVNARAKLERANQKIIGAGKSK
ncbi:hypothetical protein ONZ43_g765 [Nemania bipapillata]|uniref:Uncharacterized protein n=1 Tax=Nemania bipapillata TaxID=110536 RepID=A0ACC2J7A9_9PEZI|nr:hypothetical protein ONZ43_g765 [Nemania bipapillata]